MALEQSINLMTVRLARDIGMPKIVEYAEPLRHRTTTCSRICPWRWAPARPRVIRMVTAYSDAGQWRQAHQADLIDRVQDRDGHTIYRHDERQCLGCDAPNSTGQASPTGR